MSQLAERLGATSILMIYFPFDADVKNGDELVVSTRHFNVVDVIIPTDNTLVTAYCTEVH
jgi:hypothetical protein